jgi:hypothetical protein
LPRLAEHGTQQKLSLLRTTSSFPRACHSVLVLAALCRGTKSTTTLPNSETSAVMYGLKKYTMKVVHTRKINIIFAIFVWYLDLMDDPQSRFW